MTIEGAIADLQNLIDSEGIPFWAKPSLQKILETVEAERERHIEERKTMTHEEAVGFLQESGWLQDHDKQIYEQGKGDGIEWHPYPKEKPTMEEKRYLVTAFRGGEHQVCTEWWVDETYRFGVFTDRVTAWAELPEPYEEGADE